MSKVSFTSAPGIAPGILEQISEMGDPGWKVTVYDNSKNTYREVILILVAATNCSVDEAYCEAWEIDHYGQCIVHRADQEECERVRDIIATIGIRAVAEPELGE
ncbi:MAG: ATP-dependent Clp protease adaptor ClpS [Fimbriimonadaceae bacterium]